MIETNNQVEGLKIPEKRWGHACVAANNKMLIIGGYQGNAS
jgi:hypothetical protein